MRKILTRLRHDEAAVTAVEYALIILLVVVGIVGFVTGIGSNTSKPFAASGDAINSTVGGGGSSSSGP